MLPQIRLEEMVNFQPILFHDVDKAICTSDFRNLNELVLVVLAKKQRSFFKQHFCKRAASTPNVEAVVVSGVFEEELRAFIISTGDTDVIFLARYIELSQPPVNYSEFLGFDVKHDILRFNVAVHNSV